MRQWPNVAHVHTRIQLFLKFLPRFRRKGFVFIAQINKRLLFVLFASYATTRPLRGKLSLIIAFFELYMLITVEHIVIHTSNHQLSRVIPAFSSIRVLSYY